MTTKYLVLEFFKNFVKKSDYFASCFDSFISKNPEKLERYKMPYVKVEGSGSAGI